MATYIQLAGCQSCRLRSLYCRVAVVLLVVADPAARTPAGAEELPDLATIRAAVDAYAGHVRTLEGKWVLKTSVGARAPVPPKGGGTARRLDTTFLGDLNRGLTRLDERTSYSLSGRLGEELPFETHEVRGFDGSQPYVLFHSLVKSPIASQIPADLPVKVILGLDDAIGNRFVPWDFCGLRLFGQGTLTLAELLRDAHVAVDGEEDANGATCIRVVQLSGDERPIVVWLDPDHDYLPRRIEMTPQVIPNRPGTSSESEWSVADRFDVLEFGKFRDESDGVDTWFPVRGTVARPLRSEQSEFEVIELSVNGDIDPGRFAIDEEALPEGVLVNRGGQEEYYTGGRQDLWAQRQRLLDQENERINALLESPPPANDPFDGLPIPSFVVRQYHAVHWTTWLLVALSLVLAIGGGISFFRDRRGQGS